MKLDDETLSDFLDGELDAETRARVEASLAVDPAARARLADLERVSLLARAGVAGLSRAQAPEELQNLVLPLTAEPGATRSPGVGGPALWAMAASLALGIGLGLWWGFTPGVPDTGLAAQPVAWHRQAAWYHNLVAGQQSRSAPLPLDARETDGESLSAALVGLLGRPVVVPDLSREGLELLGARLVASGEPAAQVFYRGPDDQLLSLLVAPDPGPDLRPTLRSVDRMPILHWRQGGYIYVLAGDVGPQRMMGLGEQIMVAVP